jgi:Cu-processing system ATP-binding protein
VIRIESVSKKFGGLDVLKGVDLSIERGRITAIVGPNGSGKTTLIKMLLGLVKPDGGRITWENLVLNGDCHYRQRIGYMPQIVRFPENLSGRELLAMISDVRSRPSLDTSIDTDLIDAFSLEADLGKPFRTLSGGTRQKVNAALAFRFRPELLILDEPTAGLDPVAARALKQKVRKERENGRTVIITSHNMAELETLADDIAFLLEGRVRYRGTLEALKHVTEEPDLEGAIARMMTGTAP